VNRIAVFTINIEDNSGFLINFEENDLRVIQYSSSNFGFTSTAFSNTFFASGRLAIAASGSNILSLPCLYFPHNKQFPHSKSYENIFPKDSFIIS